MKNILFALLFGFTAIQAQAGTITGSKEHNDLVRTIYRNLRFSDKVKQEAKGSVAIVNFIINDKGVVEVKEVISDSPVAKDAIEAQMRNMPIYKTPVLPNTLYTMKVSFSQQ